MSIRDLVELTCRKLEAAFDEVVEVVGDRPGKDAAYLLDSSRACEMLGWKSIIGLDEGLDETVAWLSEHFEALKIQPLEYIHKP